MFVKWLHNLNLMFKAINRWFDKRPRKFVVPARAVMATVLGLTLSVVLVDALTLSTTSMFSAPEKRDFQMSDLFAQIADNRPVRKYDDRIVIVNIGRGGRYEIAEALSTLSLCGPKAVGIDINFADPGSDDSFLLDAISSCPNVVLPLGVGQSKENGLFKITEKPFFFEEYPEFHYGVVNLPLTSTKGTVREYAIDFPTEIGIIPSFVTALAQIENPEAVKSIRNRHSDTGVTAFHSREFLTINLEEVEQYAEDLTDKIVLVGALEDSGDMHATPVKSHVAGVFLHAAAISTVLDGVWYQKIPKSFDYIIAVSICLILMLISYGFRNNLKGIALRILQGLLAYGVVRIGYHLYVDRNIIMDISFTIMIVAFGFLASDIWNGLETLWKMASEKIDKLDAKYNPQLQLC